MASREVKAPAIKPGLPMEEEQAVQRGPLRVWGDHRKGKQAAVPNGHQDGLDPQILKVNAGIAWT